MAAAEKGKKMAERGMKQTWRGELFHVFQDLTPEIQPSRSKYADTKKKLRGAGLRHGLIFPARLVITVDGQKHTYKTPDEAVEDLAVRLPSIFG